MACHTATGSVSLQVDSPYVLVESLNASTKAADDCGNERPSVKPSIVSTVILELLAERGWTTASLAQALSAPASTIEKRLAPGFSPCVATLSNTCAPLGYEVMLVPAGTRVEGGFRITE